MNKWQIRIEIDTDSKDKDAHSTSHTSIAKSYAYQSECARIQQNILQHQHKMKTYQNETRHKNRTNNEYNQAIGNAMGAKQADLR